jgi:hypothetical protein
VDDWKNITNCQNSVRKKSFGGTFSFSNCHIIGLDNGSLVLIVFGIGIHGSPCMHGLALSIRVQLYVMFCLTSDSLS